MYRVYIDHNIVDDISKGLLELPNSDDIVWVYSNEHFNEIQRAGDSRFLDVLRRLRAQKLELRIDGDFRMTGAAYLSGKVDPYDLYDSWCKAKAEVKFLGDYFFPALSRLFGADNADTLSSLPESFEREASIFLQAGGLLDDAQKEQVETARKAMETLFEHLVERPSLETFREALGTHGGRGGNLIKHENPLEELWSIIAKTTPGITADQFFGFDPPEKYGYDELPIYLGIIGCYIVLNMIGLRPDEKLARVDRMPAITSDASHAGYASYCHALLSEDRRLCEKAKAIYRYKNIVTRVLHLSQQH